MRHLVAKRLKGAVEAKEARAALAAELAKLRQNMGTRVAALEAERDASAGQAQASMPRASCCHRRSEMQLSCTRKCILGVHAAWSY